MTKIEYGELETLLAKLESEIGTTFAVIPDYMKMGSYIATYKTNGDIEVSAVGPTIEAAAKKVLALRADLLNPTSLIKLK